VCVIFEESGTENRIVYERPQMQIPNRPLTAAERKQIVQFPNDDALTAEARAIFSDMQVQGQISAPAILRSIFIARTSAAALEMNL
jgi:hypothetical protein